MTGAVQKVRKLPGRPKGVPNRTTVAAKEAIEIAMEGIGGTERLIKWAKKNDKNEYAFWTMIYPKLLPLQVTGANGGAIQVEAITGGAKDELRKRLLGEDIVDAEVVEVKHED